MWLANDNVSHWRKCDMGAPVTLKRHLVAIITTKHCHAPRHKYREDVAQQNNHVQNIILSFDDVNMD